jgi:chromosomal replication initiator protein
MSGFVSALRSQTASTYKEALRANDVLVIDDLEFLQGRSMQHEFCRTAINTLIDAGRQVVIASDRSPADLENFDDRVRSRLAGGLVVEIGSLGEELRLEILKSRIAAARLHRPRFEVPMPVLVFIAKSVTHNGRDLEGAVNRLLAHDISRLPMTLETVERNMRDLIRPPEPKRVRIEDIQRLVARQYNVSRSDLLCSRRTANVVRPRQVAMYLAKILTLRSLPEIGRRFGGRDHTTVLHAVRKMDALIATDIALAEEIDVLKRQLQD